MKKGWYNCAEKGGGTQKARSPRQTHTLDGRGEAGTPGLGHVKWIGRFRTYRWDPPIFVETPAGTNTEEHWFQGVTRANESRCRETHLLGEGKKARKIKRVPGKKGALVVGGSRWLLDLATRPLVPNKEYVFEFFGF